MINSVQAEIILSDKQVAEQLEQLSVKIKEGINKALEVLNQAENIKQEIEEFSPTASQAISVGEQIQHWEQVLNTVAELGDRETIQRLEQEIESASKTINEVQAQVKYTDNIFSGFMSELQKRLVEVSQLQIQVEQDKKVVEDLARETDDKYHKIQKMFSQICQKQKSQVIIHDSRKILPPPISIHKDKIVDDLNADLENSAMSGREQYFG
ncbi:MAG: hypothetical protein AAF757_14205 [Cyanobacteria bacterium P01_D01_bin.116]